MSDERPIVETRAIAVDRGDVGTRLDRVLQRHLCDVPGLSRNRIQGLIEAGAVFVNGAPALRVSRRLAAHDRLHVELPSRPPRQRPRPESLPLDVLYEDSALVVVNKAAGQVTHPAFKNPTGTLLNALLAHADGRWTPRVLTRLDKQTSGLVLVAKDAETQHRLQRAMLRDEVQKDYLAVVAGTPRPRRGVIDLALGRHERDRRRVVVSEPAGRRSVTGYERLAGSPDGMRSLVRCRLITGRTHQIRVHLAAKHWPIVGDGVYGVDDSRMSRQALHAWKLAFAHPYSSEPLIVTAPLPGDFQAAIRGWT